MERGHLSVTDEAAGRQLLTQLGSVGWMWGVRRTGLRAGGQPQNLHRQILLSAKPLQQFPWLVATFGFWAMVPQSHRLSCDDNILINKLLQSTAHPDGSGLAFSAGKLSSFSRSGCCCSYRDQASDSSMQPSAF